jgi:hypothetical protein
MVHHYTQEHRYHSTLPWEVKGARKVSNKQLVAPDLASFIGTLNNEAGFLLDRTGNRRFLVCTLTAIDWGYGERVDVHQVWAQAAHLYHSGAMPCRLSIHGL